MKRVRERCGIHKGKSETNAIEIESEIGKRQRASLQHTPSAILPSAINNALAYKFASYTCRVDHARVYVGRSRCLSLLFSCSPALLSPFLVSVLSLPLIRSCFHRPNSPPLRWPQDSLGGAGTRDVGRAKLMERSKIQRWSAVHVEGTGTSTSTRDRQAREREAQESERVGGE